MAGAGRAREMAWYLLVAFVIVVAFTGGSYRPETPGLLILRPFAALAIAGFLLLPVDRDWAIVRVPLILLAGFAVTMAIQLVPLPPSVWLTMPGHAQWAPSAQLAGLPEPWRPISLDPDLTLNSLLALLPALAILIGFAAIEARRRQQLLFLVLALGLLSMLLGLAQVAGGVNGGVYLYRFTSRGLAVGILANKNHQGVLIALLLPLLAVSALWPVAGRTDRRVFLIGSIACGVLVLPIVLAAGSRAGLGIMVLALLSVPVLVARFRGTALRKPAALITAAGFAAVAGLATLVVMFGRGVAFDRLFAADAGVDSLRVQSLPLSLRLTRDYFPFGSGYGAFDPVFRTIEPDRLLALTYFNRAHNDLVETALSGGLAGCIIVAAFLLWFASAVMRSWRGADRRFDEARGRASMSADRRLALAGSIVAGGILLASLVDYPLRAPLVAVVFSIMIGWISAYVAGGGPAPRPD